MSAPQRMCGGCGGTGLPVLWERGVSFNEFCTSRCPVCAGRGTVDAKASVKDAVADAESLRGMTHTKPATNMTRQGIARAGLGVAFETVHDGPALVQNAARAAFRAVPALRGSDDYSL